MKILEKAKSVMTIGKQGASKVISGSITLVVLVIMIVVVSNIITNTSGSLDGLTNLVLQYTPVLMAVISFLVVYAMVKMGRKRG